MATVIQRVKKGPGYEVYQAFPQTMILLCTVEPRQSKTQFKQHHSKHRCTYQTTYMYKTNDWDLVKQLLHANYKKQLKCISRVNSCVIFIVGTKKCSFQQSQTALAKTIFNDKICYLYKQLISFKKIKIKQLTMSYPSNEQRTSVFYTLAFKHKLNALLQIIFIT